MTSVAEVIRARQHSGLGELLRGEMRALGFQNANQMAKAIWGATPTGKARSSGKLSKILDGTVRPGDALLKKIAQGTGLDYGLLRDARDTVPQATPQPKALAVPTKHGEQFSLVVDQAGRATLRLNLVDIPMPLAMRALGALTSIGILSTEENPPHTT